MPARLPLLLDADRNSRKVLQVASIRLALFHDNVVVYKEKPYRVIERDVSHTPLGDAFCLGECGAHVAPTQNRPSNCLILLVKWWRRRESNPATSSLTH